MWAKKEVHNGLVLPGGGARGAYQVGVLNAIAKFMPNHSPTPFDVITGTSVGAINAATIANYADDYKHGASQLESLWLGLHASEVYNTGFLDVLRSGAHWLAALMFLGLGKHNPTCILDSRPLERFLSKNLDFDRLRQNIHAGYLRAIGISASSYDRGQAVTFFEGGPAVEPWHRQRREGVRTSLSVEHIIASSALPFLFNARCIHGEYFGDGNLRLNMPLSPVIHLGADRILVIGIRDDKPDTLSGEANYPTLGSMVGHMIDIATSDNLDSDIERLLRINKTVALLSGRQLTKTALRSVDLMHIQPSKDIRDIAKRHVMELPRSVRVLLRALGGGKSEDWRLHSYLLFEPGYVQELIDLGYHDAMVQQENLKIFLDKNRKTPWIPAGHLGMDVQLEG